MAKVEDGQELEEALSKRHQSVTSRSRHLSYLIFLSVPTVPKYRLSTGSGPTASGDNQLLVYRRITWYRAVLPNITLSCKYGNLREKYTNILMKLFSRGNHHRPPGC